MIRDRIRKAARRAAALLRREPPAVKVPTPAPLSTVTIEIYGPNDFDVRHAGRRADRLMWEEMLGHVASLTHPKIAAPRFDTRVESEPSGWPRIPGEGSGR